METLRDLKALVAEAKSRFAQYEGFDFILPEVFKDSVSEINSGTVTYYKYSAVVESPGDLHIWMPNQWFYIASYFTEYYNELLNYKKWALKVTSKERLKTLNNSKLTDEEENKLQALDLDALSKSYLNLFITDYSWWGGAKTIDRGDFFVSPILSHARLVNASQGYIAELCAFLADKQDLVKLIIDAEDTQSQSRNYMSFIPNKYPLQQITFGAPGTGKSFSIKSNPDVTEDNTIRTTFHPDSDYSTFVGCYKPTKKESNKKPLVAAGDLIEKAAAISGVANQVQYLCDNAESIIFAADELGVSTNKLIWDSFKWHNETYFVSILNSLLEERKKNVTDEITYNFCPQAFTNAYVKAWKNPEMPVFLIIEEINRGNCAQIFGDIFQLLDRDESGFSRYDITPDSDLQNYLRNVFEDTDLEDEAIKNGSSMILPNNLHIWATMNTSDQSLFPIDSAFKRRWDWKYIPIDYTDRGHYISCNGKKYSWAKFLYNVNAHIESVTQSEDKKLGYWFTGNTSTQLEITADKFVSKVVFFLWNDVFKDFVHNGKTIFKNDYNKFHKFFDFKGNVKEEVLEHFLNGLEIETDTKNSMETNPESKPDAE